MSSSSLRRLFVVGLALCLWLLPLASAHAAPRDSASGITIDLRIQQFGRILLQSIARFLPGPWQADTSSVDQPGYTDGVGIDPHGGVPGRP